MPSSLGTRVGGAGGAGAQSQREKLTTVTSDRGYGKDSDEEQYWVEPYVFYKSTITQNYALALFIHRIHTLFLLYTSRLCNMLPTFKRVHTISYQSFNNAFLYSGSSNVDPWDWGKSD